MKTILRTEAITIGYGQRTLLKGLDLALMSGALVSILGRNGSGKSTLLRALCGLRAVQDGTVLLDGAPIGNATAAQRARRIAVVFPGRNTAGQVTVAEAVAMGRHPWTGWTGSLHRSDKTAIDEAMAFTGTNDWRDRPLSSLSDGEHQRVMIARAIAQDTPVVLLDEPTAFLDLTGRVSMMRLFRAMARDKGKSVLMSTHDLQSALELSDALLLIGRDGRCWQGTPTDAVVQGAIAHEFDDADVHFDPVLRTFRPR